MRPGTRWVPGRAILDSAAYSHSEAPNLGRILSKLDLRDRGQAVILAYECGLTRVRAPSGVAAIDDVRSQSRKLVPVRAAGCRP